MMKNVLNSVMDVIIQPEYNKIMCGVWALDPQAIKLVGELGEGFDSLPHN